MNDQDNLLSVLMDGIDPVAWMAASDILEESGQLYQAHVWRRRGRWGKIIIEYLEQSVIPECNHGFILTDRPWHLEAITTQKTIIFKMINDACIYRSRVSLRIKSMQSVDRIRNAIFTLVEKSIRQDVLTNAPQLSDWNNETIATWLRNHYYKVKVENEGRLTICLPDNDVPVSIFIVPGQYIISDVCEWTRRISIIDARTLIVILTFGSGFNS